MRRTIAIAVLGLILSSIEFSAAFPPAGVVPRVSPDKERQLALAWMDGLGIPDVKHLKFVRVQLASVEFGGDAPMIVYKYGFLLEDQGKTFKILNMDMDVTVHERTAPDVPPSLRIDHDPADLLKYITAPPVVMQQEFNNFARFRGRAGEVEEPLTVSAETSQLFLAWVCARRGLDDVSAKLYKDAAASVTSGGGEEVLEEWLPGNAGQPNITIKKTWVKGGTAKTPTATLQERAARNLAVVEMSRAFLASRDEKVSRAQLLQRFERIGKLFPKSEHHAQACDIALQLKLLLAEDDAHAARQKQPQPGEKLSEREQITELIYQLRNQTGLVIDQRGNFVLLSNPQSPARQLVARGFAAVPLLLEALDDKRLTRTGHAQTIYAVADCAEIILGEISGLAFGGNGEGMGYVRNLLPQTCYAQAVSLKDRADEKLLRAVFSAWYADLRKKGEKQLLIEATRRGDRDSLELGRRLISRYPDDALPALIAAARGNNDLAATPYSLPVNHLRGQFVDMICSIPGDKSTEFLLTEVREGPFHCRMAAAQALHDRDRREGLAAMISEWQDENPRMYQASLQARTAERNYGFLINFLARAGKHEAIVALGKNLQKRPVDLRVSVLHCLDRESAKQIMGGDKLWAEMEAMLIGCLDDFEERQNWALGSENIHLEDPRVCDVAAHMLCGNCPEKYAYNLGAVPAVRNRQLLEMKNVWRKANNLPLLPIPQPRTFTLVPARLVLPHLEKILDGPVERKQAQEAIEKLGVGAFWAVLDYRDQIANTPLGNLGLWAQRRKEEHDILDGLAKRLACTLTEVQFAPESLKPDAALRQRFEGLRNRPLDAKTFAAAIEATAKSLPTEVHGVQFSAQRCGDGTGFTLYIDLLSRERAVYKANSVQVYSEIVQAPPALNVEVPVPPGAGGADKSAADALAVAQKNARRNNIDPARKLYYTVRMRSGSGKNGDDMQGRLLLAMGGGAQMRFLIPMAVFPIVHSSVGHYLPSSSWPPINLHKALVETLAADPGEPLEINIRFTRTGEDTVPMSRGRYSRW